jgi:hypothetical protein
VEGIGIDGRLVDIRTTCRETGWEGVWIHLAQNGDQWQAIVNIIMNFLFP